MPRDGTATKNRILDVAQEAMLDRGFGGMSLDSVIDDAGITKGTFYYHFEGKAELARALIERFAEMDREHLLDTEERASRLSNDPLQQLLIAVGLSIEDVSEPEAIPAGCLYAAFCYQTGLFEPEVMQIVRDAVLFWRENLTVKFREIMELYPPNAEVTPEELADQFLVAFEGGFVMMRSLDDNTQLVAALKTYRNYLELLFRQN